MLSLKLPFLQISPKIWADENHLYAKTSLFYRFLNLFFYSRTVIADRIKKHIEIKVKTFWFFTSKKYIAFKDIKYIDIEKPENNLFALPKSGFTTEILYVRVICENSPYPEYLFRFIGDSGADDYWGHIKWFDFVGDQYEKALTYAEQVSKYTGSQLFKDTKIEYNIKVDNYKCLKCGHVSPSRLKCVYCGSQEMEKMS